MSDPGAPSWAVRSSKKIGDLKHDFEKEYVTTGIVLSPAKDPKIAQLEAVRHSLATPKKGSQSAEPLPKKERPNGTTPEQLTALVGNQLARYGKAIRDNNIKAE